MSFYQVLDDTLLPEQFLSNLGQGPKGMFFPGTVILVELLVKVVHVRYGSRDYCLPYGSLASYSV